MFQGKEYIYEVYKERSFSKAASKLYIAQPSLSAAVKKKEKTLGFPIFDRSTNPIGLTEKGQKYIEYIEQLMDMEHEFQVFNSDLDSLKTGRLNIGGTNLFSSYVLPPLISRFMAQYPGVHVSLTEDSTSALENQLTKGALDLIIDNFTFSPDVFDKTFFAGEHLLLAVPSHLPVNQALADSQLTTKDIKRGIHLTDDAPCVSIKFFQDCPFILLRSGNDTLRRSTQVFHNAGVHPRTLLELDQQVTAYNIACFGMGISFVSDTLIRQLPPEPRITYYKLDDPVVDRGLFFYYKRGRYMTRAMEEFLKLSCG